MKYFLVPLFFATISILISCNSSDMSDEEKTLESLAKYSSDSSKKDVGKTNSAVSASPKSAVLITPTLESQADDHSKEVSTPISIPVSGSENLTAEDNLMKARNLLQQGFPKEAIEELDQAIQKDPDNLEAFAGKVEIRLGLGDLDLALIELGEAITKFEELAASSEKIAHHLQYLYIVKAQSHEKLGQLPEAKSTYDNVIKLDSEDSIGFAGRAWINFKLAEFGKSTEDFEKALTLDSTNVLNLYFATFPYLYLGEYKRVIELTDQVIELDPTHGNAFNRRGLAHSGLGEYELALEDLNKAIEIYSDRSNYFMERSFVYESLGQSELAVQDHNTACKLHEQFGDLDNPMLCLP